jgi:beta-glucosidase
MLLGNYNGTPSDPITPLRGIREAVGASTKVLYARGSDLADNFPVLDLASTDQLTTPDGKRGLRAEYFDNAQLSGSPLYESVEPTVNASFGLSAPFKLNPDNFSVRWTGVFKPQRTGTYRLALNGTMRFTLYLNDSALVRSYGGPGGRGGGAPPAAVATGATPNAFAFGEPAEARLVQSPPIQLDASKTYTIRIEGQETAGDASLQLLSSAPAEILEAEAMSAAQQADAVVMVLGLTARLEGEEMPVQIDGFRGGDRTKLDLPPAQEAILEKVVALGKPTVLVLLNGSALAVNWASERVPAIVEGWYPGQAGGQAIADVLFGDYNPAGRLPVTFYRDTTDLPAFTEYKMEGRTYRYFKGKPLFAFGHGLSYTSFGYRNLRTSAPTISSGGKVTVSVDVTNTGKRAGDEVVQLYTSYPKSNVSGRANRDLRGFRRVTLKPGQTRTVSFDLPASRLAYWDERSNGWKLEDAAVNVEIGASSADIRLTKSLKVISR